MPSDERTATIMDVGGPVRRSPANFRTLQLIAVWVGYNQRLVRPKAKIARLIRLAL